MSENIMDGKSEQGSSEEDYKPPVGIVVTTFILVLVVFIGFAFVALTSAFNIAGAAAVGAGGVLTAVARFSDVADKAPQKAALWDRWSAILLAVGGIALAIAAVMALIDSTTLCKVQDSKGVWQYFECSTAPSAK